MKRMLVKVKRAFISILYILRYTRNRLIYAPSRPKLGHDSMRQLKYRSNELHKPWKKKPTSLV